MLNTASHQVHIKVIKKNGISVGTRLHFLISIPDLVVWSQNCIISHIRFTCVCFLIVHYSGARESGCRGGVYGKLISLVNSKHCCLMRCGGRGPQCVLKYLKTVSWFLYCGSHFQSIILKPGSKYTKIAAISFHCKWIFMYEELSRVLQVQVDCPVCWCSVQQKCEIWKFTACKHSVISSRKPANA